MEIDKNVGGEWLKQSDYIDDIAYSLYIKERLKHNYSVKPSSQKIFKSFRYFWHSQHYIQAELLLRREKINKILSRGNR